MSFLYLADLITGNSIPHTQANNAALNTGFKIFYGIIGATAVLLLVVAAVRYTISAGDANKISESKRMIAYTLVGLAVVALAGTLVEFVLKAQS